MCKGSPAYERRERRPGVSPVDGYHFGVKKPLLRTLGRSHNRARRTLRERPDLVEAGAPQRLVPSVSKDRWVKLDMVLVFKVARHDTKSSPSLGDAPVRRYLHGTHQFMRSKILLVK